MVARCPSSTSPPAEPPPDGSTSRMRLLALAALTAILVGLCALLAAPLLPALTLSAALAVLAWPAHERLNRWTGRPGLAALATTAVVGGVLVGAGVFVTYQLVRTAAAAEHSDNRTPGRVARDAASQAPVPEPLAAWAGRTADEVDRHVREAAGRAGGLVCGSIQAVVQLAVALFLLFHLLRDRARLLEGVRGLLPLSRGEADRVFARTAEAVHANLYANGVTSAIDAAIGALVFWAVGLPSPAVWAAVIFVASLVPPFGAILVWVPATLYLGLTGRWPESGAVLTYGLVTWALVDNLLYARLAGGRAGMHPAVALLAVLGGVTVFGAVGLVLGPAVLAVTSAVLEVWRGRQVDEGVGGLEPDWTQNSGTDPTGASNGAAAGWRGG